MSESLEKKDNNYCIKVKGILNHKWTDWFDGLAIKTTENDDTLLVGPISDQASLHGILAKIRDLGLTLISVQMVEDKNEIGE